MRTVYHLVPRHVWQQAPPGPYRADSLASEGFIHCCNRAQVERVANLFFAGATELLALALATSVLSSPVRDEDPGVGEQFPHVYGPIDRAAIVAVIPLQRDGQGRWTWPPEAA